MSGPSSERGRLEITDSETENFYTGPLIGYFEYLWTNSDAKFKKFQAAGPNVLF